MMMKSKPVLLAAFALVLGQWALAERVAVVYENFDELALNDTTDLNKPITDGSYDAGLQLHNHLVGEVVTPHISFSTASGNVLQLTTGTNVDGGWGLLSADNSPRAVTLIEGENMIFSFDMYVQAVPGTADAPELELRLDGSAVATRDFTELSGASMGDVIHVSWTVPVTASMTAASTISPRIGFEGHQNNFSNPGTNVDVAQIDNLKLEVPTILPTYYVDADGGHDGNTGTSPDDAWASLDKVSSTAFAAGSQILLQRGDVFNGKLVMDGDSGTTELPIVVGAYGTGNRPVIDAAGYRAGIDISNYDHLMIRDLEITGDGGTHVDGTNGKDRAGVYLASNSDYVTISNVYFHTIYPPVPTESEGHNPTTYMGRGVDARGQSGNYSDYLTIVDCHFENLGMTCINMTRQSNMSVLNNLMENIGGPAMVPNRCDDLLVRGNTVDGSGQYTDVRMHGRGSGIWPIRCNRVLIEKNKFMHARGRYDSCGAHIDIGNYDVVIQHNLSMDNEGGFVEILGENNNCSYRYNISINDGARKPGTNENGLGVGDGHVFICSGHNGATNVADRAGATNSYVYNNTIYVKDDQHCSFGIEDPNGGILIANNLFYIDGEAEDGTPYWFAKHPAGCEDLVVWTNNVYQRGGIFPEDWIFYEGAPIYGNPELANPGGLTAEDYIPTGTFVEGRGIEIPKLPGDSLGLLIGLEVTEDYFGNPILGTPDIGAVEVGGGISTVMGSAFDGHLNVNDGAVSMNALATEGAAEYRFEELSGNLGGTGSVWQAGTAYENSGLLPNTKYAYRVTSRDTSLVEATASVVEFVTPPSQVPFVDPLILQEDFSSASKPQPLLAPFPVNTWYMDDTAGWKSVTEGGSVTISGQQLVLGFGYDEVMPEYYTDYTWDLSGDYTFTGRWEIVNVFGANYGIMVGLGEYDPVTGEMLQRIKEITVGDVGNTAATVGTAGDFSLSLSSSELQVAGVRGDSLVGIFFHRDDDGTLYSQGSAKSDMYSVDNLALSFIGDSIDSDGDGVPDTVEIALGLNPNDPSDGAGDLDGDGINNADEYLIGTELNRSSDFVGMEPSADSNTFNVTIPESDVMDNRLYILEQKGTLMSDAPWIAVDAQPGTGSVGDQVLQYPTVSTQSFFRVRVDWE